MIQSLKNRKIISFIIMLLLFGATAIISGCKKDEPDNNNNNNNSNTSGSTALVLKQQDATPYQYIQVQLPEGSQPVEIQNNLIEIKIGNSTVSAYRFTSPELGQDEYIYQLLVPMVEEGRHKISTKMASGKDAEAEINIKSLPAITNPEVYIQDFTSYLDQKFREVSVTYEDMVQQGLLNRSTADSIKTIMQQAMIEIPSHSANLTAEEKIIYVRMLQSNKHWIDEYYAELAKYPLIMKKRSNTDPCADLREELANASNSEKINDLKIRINACERDNCAPKLIATNGYTGKLQTAFNDAKSDYNNTSGPINASKAFIKTFWSSASTGIWEQFKQNNNISDDPLGLETFEDAKNKSAMTFIDGENTNLSAGITVVNLNRQSLNIIPAFKPLLYEIDVYNNNMNNLSEVIPNVPKIEVLQRKAEKFYISGYTVDNISDSRISASTSDGNNGRVIKFSIANGVTEAKIPFSFRMNVSTKYGNVFKTIDAELLTNSIYGKWYVEKTYFSDNNTPGSFEPGQGAYILFETNGTYSVYDKFGQLDVSLPYTYDKDNKLINIKGSDPFTYKITLFTNNQLVLRYAEKDVIEEVYLKR